MNIEMDAGAKIIKPTSPNHRIPVLRKVRFLSTLLEIH
jgi:hypothetical protein